MANAFAQATEVVAHLTPQQVWAHVGRSDKQFLLLGDSHHADTKITRELTKALPALAQYGVRHTGLEIDPAYHARAHQAFYKASAHAQQSGRDADQLRRHLANFVNAYLAEDIDLLADSVQTDFNLLATARAAAVQVHCLNPMLDFKGFLRENKIPQAKKYDDLLKAQMAGSKEPKGTTQYDCDHLGFLCDLYHDYNMGLDPSRAGRLREIAGPDRAGMLFGSGHFRRTKAEGIDKHLPARSTVYVMLGEEDVVLYNMRQQFRQHRGSVPDFVVTTDTEQGWVLPPARKNGLWPA